MHLHSFICFSAPCFSVPETRCSESSSGFVPGWSPPSKSFQALSPRLWFIRFRMLLIARSRDPSESDGYVSAAGSSRLTAEDSYAPAGCSRPDGIAERGAKVSPDGLEGGDRFRLALPPLSPPTDPLVPRRCTICYSITKRFSSRIVHMTLYDITLYDYYQRYGKIIQLRLQLMLLLVR